MFKHFNNDAFLLDVSNSDLFLTSTITNANIALEFFRDTFVAITAELHQVRVCVRVRGICRILNSFQ